MEKLLQEASVSSCAPTVECIREQMLVQVDYNEAEFGPSTIPFQARFARLSLANESLSSECMTVAVHNRLSMCEGA